MSNLIEDKSFEFAVRIVKLSKYLNEQKKRICVVITDSPFRHKHRRKRR